MEEDGADKSYELCLIYIHESISTYLWKATLVCLMVVWSESVNL